MAGVGAASNPPCLKKSHMNPFLPLPSSREMVGWEYSLHMAQEPHLFVLRKQKRDGSDRTTPVAAYYILDGSIYQAPSLHAVIGSRICRALHHLRAAFSMTQAALDNPEAARSKEAERSESEGASVEAPDTPAASEAKPTAADISPCRRCHSQ
ncbi:unnamed protein product [Closterium sp. Naga37s-1]|nr:unnamed protein product [Closterium sp. Naga37s-1]